MPPADACRDILARLEALGDEGNVEGMKRFCITGRAYGVRMPQLREIAREAGRDHELALALWEIPVRETRILASLVDEPGAVTRKQMEDWAASFDGWEICDQCCMNLFRHIDGVEDVALRWSRRHGMFVKRAGYVLMAVLAVHRKQTDDGYFERFFPAIVRGADDDRRYVKKAVSWALRQIGKRNARLHREAMTIAGELRQRDSTAARWIARDAVRELTSKRVQQRLRRG